MTLCIIFAYVLYCIIMLQIVYVYKLLKYMRFAN